MDFESRQKLAVEEINLVLAKYNLGLNAQMNYTINGIIPVVKLIELPTQEKTNVETKEKKSKGKK